MVTMFDAIDIYCSFTMINFEIKRTRRGEAEEAPSYLNRVLLFQTKE